MSSHTKCDSSSSIEPRFDTVDLDSEERDDPTVLEYARFHGLCTDYLLEQPRINDIPVASRECFEANLRDPADLSVTNGATSELTKERLTVNKKAAFMLKSIQLPKYDEDPMVPSDDWRRANRWKVEVPILRSDEELDLLNFGCTDTPSFKNLRIPFELIDVEKDEGLEWPKKYCEYLVQFDKQAKVERLAILREDLVLLGDIVKDHWTSDVSELIKEESLEYMRNPAFQPITPPLLPLSPPLTPYVPSSPDNHLELLSESTNSVAVEAKAFEDSIMKADGLVRLESDNSDAMLFDDIDSSQAYSHFFDNPSSPPAKRKIEDLKAEGPLTPPIFSETPIKKLKSVTFLEMLYEYIPELPSHFESGEEVLNLQDSFVDIFRQQIEDYTTAAIQRIENEKLSEVDTTTRVDIPNLDFSLPVAPWNEFARKKVAKHPSTESELDAQMKFLLRVKRSELKLVSSWHGISKLERDLPWTPFLTAATVTFNEKILGEDILCKMMAELNTGNIATSSTDLWNQDGLRILKEEEGSDDELEAAEFQERNDMDALIRKRKLEIDEAEAEADAEHRRKEARAERPIYNVFDSQQLEAPRVAPREVIQSHYWGALPPTPRGKTEPPRQRAPPKLQQPLRPKEDDSGLMFGGSFSASTELHKFMEIHGKSVPKVNTVEGRTSNTNHQPTISLATGSIRLADTSQVYPPPGEMHQMKPAMPPPPLPELPSVPKSLQSCSFIISTTLLQQRNLTREIEKLYPNAEFIQRDFTTPNSAAREADLLLSPSTGLVFTTLQQVKQRALSGQPNRSPLKERVFKLQYRYERLVVLISEGLTREMEEYGSSRPVDSSDKEVITLFEHFTEKMDGDVLVKYIHGGELALARSIVGEMANWGLPHGSKDIRNLKPVQDEGTWELFLRRAGFNTYAAQVIIGSLQTLDPYPLSLSSPSLSGFSDTVEILGLTAFILMNDEERVRTFQGLLGGSRILKRVNRVLDQKWPSAMNGFAV